jgi:hypothetical protein
VTKVTVKKGVSASTMFWDLLAVHFFQAELEKNSAKFFDNIEKM